MRFVVVFPALEYYQIFLISIYIAHITVDAKNYVYVICMITSCCNVNKMAGLFVIFFHFGSLIMYV